jgi:hypothetical protein
VKSGVEIDHDHTFSYAQNIVYKSTVINMVTAHNLDVTSYKFNICR